MHLIFTSFDTYYIFYSRRGRSITCLQLPPSYISI